ncbi:MAG: hypothetical protein OXU79_13050 [Gemmatimonadota bacterium]|nr:hypothetical protein [Gemmatimonadota bacterium]
MRFDEERDNLCFQYWLIVPLKTGLVFIDPNLLGPKPQVTDHLIPNMRHEGEWPRVVLARLGVESGSFASLVSEGQESLPCGVSGFQPLYSNVFRQWHFKLLSVRWHCLDIP